MTQHHAHVYIDGPSASLAAKFKQFKSNFVVRRLDEGVMFEAKNEPMDRD